MEETNIWHLSAVSLQPAQPLMLLEPPQAGSHVPCPGLFLTLQGGREEQARGTVAETIRRAVRGWVAGASSRICPALHGREEVVKNKSQAFPPPVDMQSHWSKGGESRKTAQVRKLSKSAVWCEDTHHLRFLVLTPLTNRLRDHQILPILISTCNRETKALRVCTVCPGSLEDEQVGG